MEASCSCNCTCSGTWVTPMVSVPVHDISFGGDNAMHCSQSSSPRHQLGCNLPSLNRSPRSTDNYNDPNDSNQVILIISAFVIYTVVVILCTLMVSKRLKRCVRNNNQDVWPFFCVIWLGVYRLVMLRKREVMHSYHKRPIDGNYNIGSTLVKLWNK